MTVTDPSPDIDRSKPNPDLVRLIGETYRTSYVHAWVSLPQGVDSQEQRVRSEIAHRYALGQCGRLRRHYGTFASHADAYARQQEAYAAGNRAAARTYAERLAS